MEQRELEELAEWFVSYCRGYYQGDVAYDRNILLKEEHTQRVRGFAAQLAAELHLADDECRTAEAVALCHDVGRFEQFRRYRTFRDADSENHAALGARVLRGAGVLDCISEGERELVLRAVALHNVFALPPGLDQATVTQARLIRDADKLDIWRVFHDFYLGAEEERADAVTLGFPDLPVCSPEALAALLNGEMVRLDSVATLADFKLLQLSWLFDLNSQAACRLARENGHLARIAATLPPDPAVREAVNVVMAALAERAG